MDTEIRYLILFEHVYLDGQFSTSQLQDLFPTSTSVQLFRSKTFKFNPLKINTLFKWHLAMFEGAKHNSEGLIHT